MRRATKLGAADRRRSTREVSKRHTERAKSDLATRRALSKVLNADSVWAEMHRRKRSFRREPSSEARTRRARKRVR